MTTMKINFKTFLEDSKGAHGEYVNDVTEKTMVHAIINQLFNGRKEESIYSQVYSFIESDLAASFYDKYYDAFAEKSVSREAKNRKGQDIPLSPKTSALLNEFKKELPSLFAEWKRAQK